MPQNNWIKRATAPVSTESMLDPDTRFRAARHEAGHAVVGESIHPGSVDSMALTHNGGVTSSDIVGNKWPEDLTRDDLDNLSAVSMAGGLSEPGGTTITHSKSDRDFRNKITGERAVSPINSIHRLITGGVGNNDSMLQAPQIQAEGQARANLVLQDPNSQSRIDRLASGLNMEGQLAGNQVRRIIKQ